MHSVRRIPSKNVNSSSASEATQTRSGTQDPVCSQGLGTMLGHTSAPSGARPRSSHPHPPFLYIFKTPNGVRFPRPSFTSTSAVPRCPALSRAPFLTAHLLSRAFPRAIFTSTAAVPRFPAHHFYQHSGCPALSRGHICIHTYLLRRSCIHSDTFASTRVRLYSLGLALVLVCILRQKVLSRHCVLGGP